MSTISSASATITAATANGYVTVADATPFVVDAFVWLNKTGQPNLYCQITEITGNNIGVQAQPAPGSGPSYGRTDVSLYNTGTIFQDVQDVYSFEPSTGGPATTADLPDSLNKRYVTDAQLVVIGNTSGTNTGDQTSVSGNAGTATALQTARNINGVSFNGTANIITPTIANTNGAGASDVGTLIGVTTANASLNASAKIASVRSGIGGTENEKAYFLERGAYVAGILEVGGASGTAYMDTNVTLTVNSTAKLNLLACYNTGSSVFGVSRLGRIAQNVAVSNTQGSSARFRGFSDEVVVAVEHVATRTADLQRWVANADTTPSTRASVTINGRMDQYGTDSSGTPGAATIDKPTGISAIANGATTVVITCNQATTSSLVFVSWLGDHGAARSWVTRAAGSFTVNLSAAAGADTSFCWEVKSLL